MRDIDRLVQYINEVNYLSSTEKRVLINRVVARPTREEISRAHQDLEVMDSITKMPGKRELAMHSPEGWLQ